MKKLAMAAAVACGMSLAQPLLAQDETSADERAMQQMAEIFKADPLTPEQEARLPAAEAVVMKIFPPGTYMKITTDETMRWMTEIMDKVEPEFRDGLGHAYAVRFDASELAEMSRFFATPAGEHYAAESMLIMTDPQVMSKMSKMMPMMMEAMPEMAAAIQERTAALPAPKSAEDLTDEERAKLAELMGVDADKFLHEDD